jgi:hypothetical protein
MSDILSNARRFFTTSGRPVDRARFAMHFDGGTPKAFLSALGEYQNPDGGFGHALEVDIAAPESQPFATELALKYCLDGGIPASDPLIQKTVAYLEASQEADGSWRFRPEIYTKPMAPWFKNWTWPNLNPTCTTAGILLRYGLGSARLHQRVRSLFEQLADVSDIADGEFYSIRPYAMYFQPDWDHPQREFYLYGLLWWHIRQHLANKIADNGHWFEYIESPRAWLGRHMPAAILQDRLNRLEGEQMPDGGWPTPYNQLWRGPVTINNLIILRAFGRI